MLCLLHTSDAHWCGFACTVIACRPTCLSLRSKAAVHAAELSKHAPPLFKQPPKKRQKLSSQQPEARASSLFRPATRSHYQYQSHDHPGINSHHAGHPLLSVVKTEVSSDNSPECNASPDNPSDMASEPASSSCPKDTPGSTASWQPTPRGGGHSTPLLLFPSSSGHHTNQPASQAMGRGVTLNSTSKGSSNAETPVEPNSQGLQANTGCDQPSGASTAGHSVIDTVVGPSPFDPSDSIKRQLLAAVGGSLDVASLEGLVRPLFASPPGAEQADLNSLLLAAQHQAHLDQQQAGELLPADACGQADGDNPFKAEHGNKADAGSVRLTVPALKLQTNPITKPHAVPRNLDVRSSAAASADQAGDHAPASGALSHQADLHRAASAHMAAMLQIPFSGLNRMELWQPPPLKLDSPPLTLSPHSPLTSMPAVITPVTLSSISNLTQHHQQQLLPSVGIARPTVMSNPAALQKALQRHDQHDAAALDLDALMKAVRAEGAPLYAAATALDRGHAGDCPIFTVALDGLSYCFVLGDELHSVLAS